MENNEKIERYEDDRKLILAVDDEESILDLLKFNIEKEGFRFIQAQTGDEGLKKAIEENRQK